MKTAIKYQPKSLDDVIFPNTVTETLIRAYVSRQLSSHLLLWGPNGTGKTILANLLPTAIEGSEPYVEDKDFDELLRDRNLMDYIMRQHAIAKLKPSNYYMVFHEFDDAKNNLPSLWKAADKCNNLMIIITTNNPMNIHSSIRSRCQVVEMPRISVEKILPRCIQILDNEGIRNISHTTLKNELERSNANGDMRKYFQVIDRIILSSRQFTGTANIYDTNSKGALSLRK